MRNYNLEMLEAKRNLDQRLELEKRRREDGENSKVTVETK